MSLSRLFIVIATFGWLITLGSEMGFAQQEWQDNLYNDPNFPNQLTPSSLQRFNDAYHNHNYEKAAIYLDELLEESPVSLSLIHQAIDVYRTLAERAEDLPQKLQRTNSLMAVYEKRLHLMDDTTNTLNRKLNDVFKILYENRQYYPELLRLFQHDTQRLGQDLAYYNLIPYATIASELYRSGKLGKPELLQTKQRIESIVTQHQDEPQQQEYQKVGESAREIFAACLKS